MRDVTNSIAIKFLAFAVAFAVVGTAFSRRPSPTVPSISTSVVSEFSPVTGVGGVARRCPPQSIGTEPEPFSTSRHFVECEEQAQYLATGLVFETFIQHPSVEHFDSLCSLFQRWMVCIKSAATRCNVVIPPGTSIESQFGKTKATIINGCIERRNMTLVYLPCMATQSRDTNPLFNGCYFTMQLRRKSNIINACRAMTEFLYCEDRLIRSACGSAMADFALAVSIENQLSSPEMAISGYDVGTGPGESSSLVVQPRLIADSVSEPCPYESSSATETGLIYSMQCPPEFPTLVRICYKEFMRTRLVVYPTMPAVVRSPIDTIHQYCTALQQYKLCVAPVEKMCPSGVQAIYAVSSEWSKNLQLALYTCDVALADYTRHMTCYSTAVQKMPGHLGLCRQLHDRFTSRHQAYSFRCSPHRNDSRLAAEERERLIECYAAFFDKQCGSSARKTILPLLRMHYSFDFLPPCGVAAAVEVHPPSQASGVQASSHGGSGLSQQSPASGVGSADINCPCAAAAAVAPVLTGPAVAVQPTTRSTRSLPSADASVVPLIEPMPSRRSLATASAPVSLSVVAVALVLALGFGALLQHMPTGETIGTGDERMVSRSNCPRMSGVSSRDSSRRRNSMVSSWRTGVRSNYDGLRDGLRWD